ncbi:hypothetical protein ACOMHN_008402 [Nucella lapillus]
MLRFGNMDKKKCSVPQLKTIAVVEAKHDKKVKFTPGSDKIPAIQPSPLWSPHRRIKGTSIPSANQTLLFPLTKKTSFPPFGWKRLQTS